jgi:hypothetical protein
MTRSAAMFTLPRHECRGLIEAELPWPDAHHPSSPLPRHQCRGLIEAAESSVSSSNTRTPLPPCESGKNGALVPLRKLSEKLRDLASLYEQVEGPDAYSQGEQRSMAGRMLRTSAKVQSFGR